MVPPSQAADGRRRPLLALRTLSDMSELGPFVSRLHAHLVRSALEPRCASLTYLSLRGVPDRCYYYSLTEGGVPSCCGVVLWVYPLRLATPCPSRPLSARATVRPPVVVCHGRCIYKNAPEHTSGLTLNPQKERIREGG